jgi:hypothetical protein
MCNHGALLDSMSTLVCLKRLHLRGFGELGQRPADVAAALRPLHHLQAPVRVTAWLAAGRSPLQTIHEHQHVSTPLVNEQRPGCQHCMCQTSST